MSPAPVRSGNQFTVQSGMVLARLAVCDIVPVEAHYWQPSYNSFSSLMSPYSNNATCDPFSPAEQPCTLGNYVVYAVNVSRAEPVVQTLKFVTKHNIRLVVRNTGHYYQEKSTGPGGLAVWMHHLKDINITRRN
ncbi:hypothetical protein BDV10DRAFT_186227 [Aspergillus recurvatus]